MTKSALTERFSSWIGAGGSSGPMTKVRFPLLSRLPPSMADKVVNVRKAPAPKSDAALGDYSHCIMVRVGFTSSKVERPTLFTVMLRETVPVEAVSVRVRDSRRYSE